MTAPSRISNKHILDALTDLPAQIAAALAQTQVQVAPVQTPAPVETAAPVNTGEAEVKVDPKYFAHMSNKVNALAASDGQQRILYTRRNGYGEVKLAYVLASKWSDLKDRGLIGAVKICDGSK
jgi:hypothetical protein